MKIVEESNRWLIIGYFSLRLLEVWKNLRFNLKSPILQNAQKMSLKQHDLRRLKQKKRENNMTFPWFDRIMALDNIHTYQKIVKRKSFKVRNHNRWQLDFWNRTEITTRGIFRSKYYMSKKNYGITFSDYFYLRGSFENDITYSKFVSDQICVCL